MHDLPPPELDIVGQNPNLSFATGVDLKFIFWEHLATNVEALAGVLDDVDTVVLEVDGFSWEPDDETRVDTILYFFNELNKVTHGIAHPEEIENLYEVANRGNHFCVLAIALANSGKTLVPVDTMLVSAEELEKSNELGESKFEDEDSLIKYIAYREAIVLRQLSELSWRYDKDPEHNKIAVVYGTGHGMLAIAARQLGANVDRQYMALRRIHASEVDNIIHRLVRWGLYDSFYNLPDEDREVVGAAKIIEQASPEPLAGLQVARLIHRLRNLQQDSGRWEQTVDKILSTVQAKNESNMPDSRNPVRKIKKSKALRRANIAVNDLLDDLRVRS